MWSTYTLHKDKRSTFECFMCFFWVRLHCKAVDSRYSIELQCFVVKFQSPALLFESINYCNIEIFMGNHSNGHDGSGGGFVEESYISTTTI